MNFFRKFRIAIVLCSSAILIVILAAAVAFAFQRTDNRNNNSDNDPTRILRNQNVPEQDLPIPVLIDANEHDNRIEINISEGEVEFFPRQVSKTKGFNGVFLGPTILTRNGQDVTFVWNNQLNEITNVHKHGLHVSGSVDGGPQNIIQPNESREEVLEIRQEASTNWYHPHVMGLTAAQVYDGLAGFFYIEDANSDALGLPDLYGIDDIPLVVQDRAFIDGVMTYTVLEGMQNHSGHAGHNLSADDVEHKDMFGNTILANGAINAYKDVPQGWVRLRLLNGSNARRLTFAFSDNRSFYVIASDGGFLENPAQMNQIELWTGERVEILVDFSDGQSASLMTANQFQQNYDINVLKFKVDSNLQSSGSFPTTPLNVIEKYDPKDVQVTRTFRLDESLPGGFMGINGAPMDMNVINERVILGQLEKWVITADWNSHPFHIHGTSFQVIGDDVPPQNQGWKDTVHVKDRVELLVKFHFEATEEHPYMYHCHVLEHEDMGMMGQFIVVPSAP